MALFMQEVEKGHVLPIDDRTIEHMNPALAGRPDVSFVTVVWRCFFLIRDTTLDSSRKLRNDPRLMARCCRNPAVPVERRLDREQADE